MTLHVGMLGSDGVILAGDTRINRKPVSGVYAPWMSYEGRKIRISDSGRVAVTCAHDMETANAVADKICTHMSNGDYPGCEREIQELGIKAAKRGSVECLIAFADPLPSLYYFQHVKIGRTCHTHCSRVLGCVPAGDTTNPSVFWGMRYYQQRPIHHLKRLATCMVLSAGKINSSIIGGFEMVECTSEGCIRVPDESAQELLSLAEERMQKVGELIMGGQ